MGKIFKIVPLVVFCLLALPSFAFAAVAPATGTYVYTGKSTTQSWSTGSLSPGTNPALIVGCVSEYNDDFAAPNFDGTPMTLVRSYLPYSTMKFYSKINPSAGSHTITATFSVGGGAICFSQLFNGVDQSNVLESYSQAYTSTGYTVSTPAEISIDGSWILSFAQDAYGAANLSVDSLTEQAFPQTYSAFALGSSAANIGTQNVNWTSGSYDHLGALTIVLKPYVASTATTSTASSSAPLEIPIRYYSTFFAVVPFVLGFVLIRHLL